MMRQNLQTSQLFSKTKFGNPNYARARICRDVCATLDNNSVYLLDSSQTSNKYWKRLCNTPFPALQYSAMHLAGSKRPLANASFQRGSQRTNHKNMCVPACIRYTPVRPSQKDPSRVSVREYPPSWLVLLLPLTRWQNLIIQRSTFVCFWHPSR